MKFSLHLGRIAGIRLTIHWSFFLLLLFIFYRSYKVSGSIASGNWGVLFVLAVFLCVVLHELGHALTARRYGIETKSITLLPIGGIASMERMPEAPSQELKVALAGPAVNIVIAGLIYAGFLLAGDRPDLAQFNENYSMAGFASQLLATNIVLALFNLLPAFPMDGGRVLRAILSYSMGRDRATAIAAAIGRFTAVGFIILGFFFNIMLVLIGVFIYFGAGMEANYQTLRTVLSRYKVLDVVMKQFTPLRPADTVGEAARLLLNSTEKNFLVMEDGQIAGVLSRDEIIKGLSETGSDTPVAHVMQKDFAVLATGLELFEAYQMMVSSGSSFAPAMTGDRLEGVVDIENVREFLMIRGASSK